MRTYLAILGCLLLSINIQAQTATQTIRGTVVDQEAKFTIPGVDILLTTDKGEEKGAVTDIDGAYVLEKVPVGRHTVQFSFVGYETVLLNNIVVSSGKEAILNIEMREGVELQTIEVIGIRTGETKNEMAPVSARQFSVEETDRYAGSRGDPARMASNFAGVQGADDSRNDIVIRGNTPQGLIWRLEGVTIPNPNHFAIPGTAGGPVAILNNKYLTNSDFFTGAFPAEFGNGIAGAFDVRMRNGNEQRHELSFQLGILGTELSAEGPLSKEKRSSYLLSYRYSTLRLFDFIGLQLGTGAVPQYQDAAFRFNFPTNNGGNLALWGIGGFSRIDVKNSEITDPEVLTNPDLYAESDRDQVFTSYMGVAGLTYTKPLNLSTFFKVTLAASNQTIGAIDTKKIFRKKVWDTETLDSVFVIDSLVPFLYYDLSESKFSAYLSLTKKFSKRTSLKAGLNTDYWMFNYLDTFRQIVIPPEYPEKPGIIGDWRVRWDTQNEGAIMLQPYVQVRHRFGSKLTATAGLTSLYFGLNDNSFSPLEPRAGLVYDLAEGQKLSLGYGLHSQIVPPYMYFYGVTNDEEGNPQEVNRDMGLFKSHHAVAGYDWFIAQALRLRIEAYYQYLFNIPVEEESSSFSLVNAGSGFDRLFPKRLVSEGTARNYGLELTVERFFSQGYYFLLTGSVFDSKYKGSDGVLRNTTFNGRFAMNGLVAREFTLKKGSALNIGGKVTWAGGRRRGILDVVESDKIQEPVFEDATMNSEQVPNYFRADLKLAYRWNRPKVLHEFSIDLVNVTNQRNLLYFTYVPNHPSGDYLQETYQLGFLPIFYYKLEFGF
jgi:hypothetical protein